MVLPVPKSMLNRPLVGVMAMAVGAPSVPPAVYSALPLVRASYSTNFICTVVVTLEPPEVIFP